MKKKIKAWIDPTNFGDLRRGVDNTVKLIEIEVDVPEEEAKDLIHSCLYNWLGYGNPNGSIWFVGVEEGGAEIWRWGTQTLYSSLQIRSRFKKAMDFRSVWEDEYGIPLEAFVKRRGSMTTWHYIAGFLLSFNNQPVNTDTVRDFVFHSKQLGRLDGDHFLCELLPLPRKNKASIEGYEAVWESVKDYYAEVIPNRFEMIKDTLVNSTGVRLIMSYNKEFTKLIQKHFPCRLLDEWEIGRGRSYSIVEMELIGERKILYLSTPFFGQGQISYESLNEAVNRLKRWIVE